MISVVPLSFLRFETWCGTEKGLSLTSRFATSSLGPESRMYTSDAWRSYKQHYGWWRHKSKDQRPQLSLCTGCSVAQDYKAHTTLLGISWTCKSHRSTSDTSVDWLLQKRATKMNLVLVVQHIHAFKTRESNAIRSQSVQQMKRLCFKDLRFSSEKSQSPESKVTLTLNLQSPEIWDWRFQIYLAVSVTLDLPRYLPAPAIVATCQVAFLEGSRTHEWFPRKNIYLILSAEDSTDFNMLNIK